MAKLIAVDSDHLSKLHKRVENLEKAAEAVVKAHDEEILASVVGDSVRIEALRNALKAEN